jgi:hypothetical protein
MLSFYPNWIYFILLLYSPQQQNNNKQNQKYINFNNNNNNVYESNRNSLITESKSCENRINHFFMNSLQLLLNKLQIISNNSTQNQLLLKASISSRNLNILRHYLPEDYNQLNCEQLEEFEDTINELIDNIILINNNNNNNNYINYDYIQNIFDLSFDSLKLLIYLSSILTLILLTKHLMKNYLTIFKLKNLFSHKLLLIIIILIIIIIAIVWKWRQLYLIELSRKQSHVINAPKECLNRCDKMTFISWFRHYLYSYESRRHDYYRAVTVDPFWEINPLTAMSELFSEFIFTPLKPLGNFLGII